jgi:hypothetical protein
LAARASPSALASPSAESGATRKGDGLLRGQVARQDTQQTKSNIVPNPAFSSPARPVAPTVLQAAPGATTTLISKRPAPPPHQQTGLPKITAGPDFVDTATLLPQRGPQGAAVRSPAAPAAAQSLRSQ